MTDVLLEPTATSVLIEAVEVWTEYGWVSATQPVIVAHHEVTAQ